MKQIVELSVSSWAGFTAGASHYYGTMQSGSAIVRLERVIDAQEAMKLYRLDELPSEDDMEVYGKTERFNDEGSLEEEAQRVWLEYYPRGWALVGGGGNLLNPGKVVAGGSVELREIGARAEELYREGEECGSCEEMDELYDRWDEEVKKGD